MKSDRFEYVNRYYGLSLTANCAVVETRTGRRGQVAKGDGQYIHIRWDGASRADGPYHPTDGLTYPAQPLPAPGAGDMYLRSHAGFAEALHANMPPAPTPRRRK